MKMLSNVPPPQDSRELWKHFSDTYFSLRMGLAVLAFAMPLVLYLFGRFQHGLDLQPSMSAYFWAASADQCASFPMRTIFVGFLFAIAVGLTAYRGLTALENVLLNVAAVCAFLIAIYPERLTLVEGANDERLARLFATCPAIEAWAQNPSLPIHYAAAVALFVILAIVACVCADKSLSYLPAQHDPAWFRRGYKLIAVAMVCFPLSGLALALLLEDGSRRLFFVEAAGIWTFGVYWAFKSYELSLSRLEADPVAAVENAEQRQRVEPGQ